MSAKTILIVDDDRLIRWTLSEALRGWGFRTLEAATGAEGLRSAQEQPPDLVFLDVHLPDGKGIDFLEPLRRSQPDLPVVMITAFGVIEDAVTAMRRGAYDYITKPFETPKLEGLVRHALDEAGLKLRVAAFRDIERLRSAPDPIIGDSPATTRLREVLLRVARSDAPIVLLLGESGTGKDLAARTLHRESRRRSAPFLAVDCSAIPESLLESELFGHERGAFTDARQAKRGLVELADEGTLFLDEIGNLSLPLQAKLLRFLETSSFRRLGGLRDIQVDLRVVAATNQDLERMGREDRFRRDLYFRLAACPIVLPPLRDRREDILPLARHFAARAAAKSGKAVAGFEPEAEGALTAYDWPGNVRELKNAVERALIFEDGLLLSADYLALPGGEPARAGAGGAAAEDLSLPEMEARLIRRALDLCGGNVTKAADRLGISRDALRYRLKSGRGGGRKDGR